LTAQQHKESAKQIVELANPADLDQIKKASIKMHSLLLFTTPKLLKKFSESLREKYSYSVLSREILDLIAAHGPLVELGAGNGYNAWLLQQMGVETIALDAFPVEEGKNWFFSTSIVGLPTTNGKSWTRIEKGDSSSVVDYTDYTLLMCWPPQNTMAFKALTDYKGQKIIVIGEKTCCASKAFYKKIAKEWKLLHAGLTGSWDANHKEYLEIYSRN
jgi:hypothetical protein